jgi:hypothetical protein
MYSKFPNGFDKDVAGKQILFVWRQRLKHKNFLFLFPNRANMVCRLDMDNGEITKLSEFDKYCVRKKGEVDASFFGNSAIHKSKLYIWHKSNIFLEYDMETREIRESQDLSQLNDDDYLRLSNDYLKSLVDGKEFGNAVPHSERQKNDGEKIYTFTKDMAMKRGY